ncbi:TonB-dependent receptor [uncultured Stenotrophomonas sp.]|uniref:TonB-dependent receptor n=1 Tax=uncultured Stenotrophomonas sp. TaxID=165438 RepID=UPI0025DB18CB|nr:TonB-dependent receptor [uncultured Stenotrophomonas sp.]
MPCIQSAASRPTRLPFRITPLSIALSAALTASPVVYAQQAPADQSPALQDKKVISLAEVTVSARKRDERQLDVPIAMTAVTGEQIKALGLHNAVDVINTTPGAASVDSGGGFTQVQIRGVSSSLGGNDNGFYVDETPFTGVTVPWYPDTRSYDIDRVEILKGPQGTLFGEGSMGGTVRILTNKPEFNAFRAGVELDASSVQGGSNGWGAKAYANIPLIDDRLALRVVATDEQLPGWIENAATGERDVNDARVKTWRAKLRYAPTDRWTIDLGYWKYQNNSDGAGTDAYDDMSNLSFFKSNNSWDSTSLTSVYDLDDSQVVYSFADGSISYPQEGDLAPGLRISASINMDIRTQELRWASTGERRVDWTVGLYARDAERNDVVLIPGISDSTAQQTNKAQAVFGEVTVELPNPAWSLTTGLRYFKDKIDAIDVAASGEVSRLNGTYDSWNPRVSLSFKPSEDVTFYLSGAKGFRSAQLQPISSIRLAEIAGIDLPAVIDADSIVSYELGMKSAHDQGRLLFEAAVYRSDWDKVAVRVPITSTINGLVNSKGTVNKGIEASLTYQPNGSFSVQAGGGWVDATYKADVPGTPLHKGTEVFNVPKATFFSAATYGWDVGQSLRGTITGQLNYATARKTSLVSGTAGDDITQLGLRIGLHSPAGWGAFLYGENLTNEDGAVTARSAPEFDMDGTLLRTGYANRLRPRTVGVLFRYDY